MKRLKGSLSEYYAHEAHWFRNMAPDPRGGREGLRMGQFIWNMMGKEGQSWPELFNCKTSSEVSRLVHKEFHHGAD